MGSCPAESFEASGARRGCARTAPQAQGVDFERPLNPRTAGPTVM
jgi:hypothetical protein